MKDIIFPILLTLCFIPSLAGLTYFVVLKNGTIGAEYQTQKIMRANNCVEYKIDKKGTVSEHFVLPCTITELPK